MPRPKKRTAMTRTVDSPATMARQRKIARLTLDAYERSLSEEAMTNRPALGIAVKVLPGFTSSDTKTLYEPSMVVYPVPDPVLAAKATLAEATWRGSSAIQIGLGEDERHTPNYRPLDSVFSAAGKGVVWPRHLVQTKSAPKDITDAGTRVPTPFQFGYAENVGTRTKVPYNSPLWTRLMRYAESLIADSNQYARVAAGAAEPTPHSLGIITFEMGNNSFWIRFHTHELEIPESLVKEIGEVPLNLNAVAKSRRDPKPLRPAQAIAVAEWAHDMGFALVDPDNSGAFKEIRSKLKRSVVGWPSPGRPAEAEVSVGINSGAKMRRKKKNGTRASTITVTDSTKLAALGEGINLILHPAVADQAALAAATPIDDDRLLPHQKLPVARHLATEVGLANISDPGAGKTIMALYPMRQRALTIPGYRALVVAEANVRKQFATEALDWFPEAHTVTINAAKDAERLETALNTAGDFPVLVITSYALASRVADHLADVLSSDEKIASLFAEDDAMDRVLRGSVEDDALEQLLNGTTTDDAVVETPNTDDGDDDDDNRLDEIVAEVTLFDAPAANSVIEDVIEPDDTEKSKTLGEVLAATHWNDIIADEAACLRNRSSKQSKALWALRANSDVAVALTGTPISRGIDDLGYIYAWARNDRHLFYGAPLSEKFDLSSKKGQTDFVRSMGPALIRVGKSEYADELPPLAAPVVMKLKPSRAELRLANAAKDELKRHYDELVIWLERAEAADPDNPEFKDVRAALAEARHAWLGGTQLARMAASDPSVLLHSESAGAALLNSQGLVAAATKETGTKRKAVVETTVKRVAEGERLVIFTEFSTVARGLIADLRHAGIRVGEVLGGGGKKRDKFVEDFRAGELDVLVATSAGERGLNLQTATTLLHYDLPWTPSGIIQRTGRLERIGATASEIKIVFCVMEGTIEERIAAIVAARASEMMQALDTSRGVKAKDSSVGRAMAGLIDAADITELKGADAALLEVTKAILS